MAEQDNNLDSWKCSSLKSRIEALSKELESRWRLKDSAVNAIEQRVCDLHTKLFELYSLWNVYDPNIQQAKARLHEQEWKLERDKSEEQVSYWKDTLDLKKELMELQDEFYKVSSITGQTNNYSINLPAGDSK